MMGQPKWSNIPAAAVDDQNLPLGALRVLNALGIYTNREGWCWPAQTTLADRLGVSRQYVARCIRTLMVRGYIERQNTPKGASPRYRYRMILEGKPETEFQGKDLQGEVLEGEIIASLVKSEQKSISQSKPGGCLNAAEGKDLGVSGAENAATNDPVGALCQSYPHRREPVGAPSPVDNFPENTKVGLSGSLKAPSDGNINVPRNVPKKEEAEFVDRRPQSGEAEWERAATAFKKRYGAAIWKSWWGQCEQIDSDPYTVQVPSKFVADHLRTHYAEFMETNLGLEGKIKLVVAAKVGGEKVG